MHRTCVIVTKILSKHKRIDFVRITIFYIKYREKTAKSNKIINFVSAFEKYFVH